MNIEDYEKFHKKGGEYVIPVEVFNEIIEEIEKLNKGYCQFKKECGNVADCMREEYFQMQHRNMLMSLENDRLKNIIKDKDKEIERLNKELQDTKEHLGEYLHEQEEENKRLNNIIDKLEKKLISDKCFFEDMYKKSQLSEEEFKKQCPYTIGSYDHCVEILNKLQELKGGK